MTFAEKVIRFVDTGSSVLDLGAGNGWFSRQCLEHGALVTAVDKKPGWEKHQGIDWHQMDVQSYLKRLQEKDMFDVVFSRNLIQFLDHEWVEVEMIPSLITHLRPAGIIAIQTFYRDPEPPFEQPVVSVWTTDDLVRLFSDFNVLHRHEFSDVSPDMRGTPRQFFLTNLIVQKRS